jgi:hypothetical protein
MRLQKLHDERRDEKGSCPGAPFSIGEAAAACKDEAAETVREMWNSVVQAESPFHIKVSLFYFYEVFEENRSVGGDYSDAKIIYEDFGASSKRSEKCALEIYTQAEAATFAGTMTGLQDAGELL